MCRYTQMFGNYGNSFIINCIVNRQNMQLNELIKSQFLNVGTTEFSSRHEQICNIILLKNVQYNCLLITFPAENLMISNITFSMNPQVFSNILPNTVPASTDGPSWTHSKYIARVICTGADHIIHKYPLRSCIRWQSTDIKFTISPTVEVFRASLFIVRD